MKSALVTLQLGTAASIHANALAVLPIDDANVHSEKELITSCSFSMTAQKITTYLAAKSNTHLLSHSSHGPGVRARLSYILYSGLPKLQFRCELGLWSSMGLRSSSKLIQVVGGIQFLVVVRLISLSSSLLSARDYPQLLGATLLQAGYITAGRFLPLRAAWENSCFQTAHLISAGPHKIISLIHSKSTYLGPWLYLQYTFCHIT